METNNTNLKSWRWQRAAEQIGIVCGFCFFGAGGVLWFSQVQTWSLSWILFIIPPLLGIASFIVSLLVESLLTHSLPDHRSAHKGLH
ncbi:MAG: hypothetical protein KDK39_03555 [Leptospiraceae bacterium]|nr:hypothetical protein [Leptospiraceae bacterium]